MEALRFARLAVVAVAPMALSACGVPDIVAHGVKAYERSQERPAQTDVAQPAQPVPAYQPAYQPANAEPEPPQAVPAAVPAREAVGVEPLR